MGSEIIVPETPNWLQELEAKRERRLKARLGHEAGAGAPCLKCEDKCPGLDLHFWRKCCKICKCTKEDHEVQDDDVYGWAQFQLLGSKPSKIKKKIVLPGKKDEQELDWVPKGHNDTIDKYLKTIPSDRLPVKGSQAAQDRKQLLQKQIPIHDIEPTLCHELNEDELNKMNEYIAHVKQNSVGVGQIVSLSTLIKGNLHTLNPQEAALIASRFAKGVPLSEIVKLQSQDRAELLRHQALDNKLHKMNISDPHANQNAEEYMEMYDKNNPSYIGSGDQLQIDAQYSNPLESNRTSAFVPYTTSRIAKPGELPNNSQHLQQPNYAYNLPHHAKNIPDKVNYLDQQSCAVQGNNPNYASSLPHLSKTISRGLTPQQNFSEDVSMQNPNYSGQFRSISRGLNPHEQEKFSQGSTTQTYKTMPAARPATHYQEKIELDEPKFATGLANSPRYPNLKHTGFLPSIDPVTGEDIRDPESVIYSDIVHPNDHLRQPITGYVENTNDIVAGDLKTSLKPLPNYSPGRHNIFSDQQTPRTLPKNVKDLAFSTYDPANADPNERQTNPEEIVLPEDPYLANQNLAKQIIHGMPKPVVGENVFSDHGLKPPNVPQPPIPGQEPSGHPPGNGERADQLHSGEKQVGVPGRQEYKYPHQQQFGDPFGSSENRRGYFYPGQEEIGGKMKSDLDEMYQPNYDNQKPFDQINSSDAPLQPICGQQFSQVHPSNMREDYLHPNQGELSANPRSRLGKKLSELHPSNFDVNEDYLQPSQVKVGAIQDINYPEIKAATHGTNDFYEDYSPESIREILNNIKLPDCHYCKKPFEENEFAVTIDRANVLFHADCFRCAGCNQILADNVYFYNKETDNIYCGRDYAKVRGFPRCKACDELIFTKEYCLAENATFHVKHFCCYECDTPLAGRDYVVEDEMPYCIPCFEQSKASKCNSCKQVIKPDERGVVLKEIHFHATDDCFACKVCSKPLLGQKMMLKNEKLYCSVQCFGADSQ